MKPVLIYVAGKWTAKERLKKEALKLMGRGRFAVISSWLWLEHEEEKPEKWAEYAVCDRSQVKFADVLIIDTMDESATGGREVELGIAMAKKKIIARVGPVRNVFHQITEFQFKDWEDLFLAIDGKDNSNNGHYFRAALGSAAMTRAEEE